MKTLMRTSSRGQTVVYWDHLNASGRLKLVMKHQDCFLESHLVSPCELKLAKTMPESAWEYILDREETPIFSSLNIKNCVGAQKNSYKLKAALRAVFL